MKIGDQVSVIDEDLKGTVTSVKGDLVVIKDEHGFTHQYQKSKVVLQITELYDQIKTVHKKETSKPVSKKHNKNHWVLDLHFENLVKNPSEYDSFERLFIQKQKLMETVEFCRKNKLKQLEIIHGIGEGVLQKMVYDYLVGQTNIEFEESDFFYHSTGNVVVRFR